MKSKIAAILIGGLAFGMLSGIPFVGWLWFIWALLGGALAILIYRKMGKVESATTKECLTIAIGAGVVGAIVLFSMAMIMTVAMWMGFIWSGRPNMTFWKAFGNTLEFMIEKDLPRTIFQVAMSLVCAVLSVAFAALGGFLGSLFLYKKPAAQPPLAAPKFGAQPLN